MVFRHTPMCIDAWWLWGACVWVEMASEARWHAKHFSHIGRCVISPDSHVDVIADMYTWFHMSELDAFFIVYMIQYDMLQVPPLPCFICMVSLWLGLGAGRQCWSGDNDAGRRDDDARSGGTIIYIIKWYFQYHWKSCPMWPIWHVPVCRLHMIWHGFLSN